MKKIYNRVELTYNDMSDLTSIVLGIKDQETKRSLLNRYRTCIVRTMMKQEPNFSSISIEPDKIIFAKYPLISYSSLAIMNIDKESSLLLTNHLCKNKRNSWVTDEDFTDCVPELADYAIGATNKVIATINDRGVYSVLDVETGRICSTNTISTHFKFPDVYFESVEKPSIVSMSLDTPVNKSICINPVSIIGDYLYSDDFKAMLNDTEYDTEYEDYIIYRKGNIILFVGSKDHYLVFADHTSLNYMNPPRSNLSGLEKLTVDFSHKPGTDDVIYDGHKLDVSMISKPENQTKHFEIGIIDNILGRSLAGVSIKPLKMRNLAPVDKKDVPVCWGLYVDDASQIYKDGNHTTNPLLKTLSIQRYDDYDIIKKFINSLHSTFNHILEQPAFYSCKVLPNVILYLDSVKHVHAFNLNTQIDNIVHYDDMLEAYCELKNRELNNKEAATYINNKMAALKNNSIYGIGGAAKLSALDKKIRLDNARKTNMVIKAFIGTTVSRNKLIEALTKIITLEDFSDSNCRILLNIFPVKIFISDGNMYIMRESLFGRYSHIQHLITVDDIKEAIELIKIM